MEKAIRLAIEGGYVTKGLSSLDLAFLSTGKPDRKLNQLFSVAFLDSLFWQCLGKSLGWSVNVYNSSGKIVQQKLWKKFWHRFIDHLASGKSPEEFFEQLLSNSK